MVWLLFAPLFFFVSWMFWEIASHMLAIIAFLFGLGGFLWAEHMFDLPPLVKWLYLAVGTVGGLIFLVSQFGTLLSGAPPKNKKS